MLSLAGSEEGSTFHLWDKEGLYLNTFGSFKEPKFVDSKHATRKNDKDKLEFVDSSFTTKENY